MTFFSLSDFSLASNCIILSLCDVLSNRFCCCFPYCCCFLFFTLFVIFSVYPENFSFSLCASVFPVENPSLYFTFLLIIVVLNQHPFVLLPCLTYFLFVYGFLPYYFLSLCKFYLHVMNCAIDFVAVFHSFSVLLFFFFKIILTTALIFYLLTLSSSPFPYFLLYSPFSIFYS